MNGLHLIVADVEITRRVSDARLRHLYRSCRAGRRYVTAPVDHSTHR